MVVDSWRPRVRNHLTSRCLSHLIDVVEAATFARLENLEHVVAHMSITDSITTTAASGHPTSIALLVEAIHHAIGVLRGTATHDSSPSSPRCVLALDQ